MNIRPLKTQSGFALLIFLVILMGVGGLALTGFSQQALKGVEAKRFAHNKRVLQEAKQALLMYAYNYPEIALGFSPPTIRGPGRLPCPDTDNSGTPNPPCTSGEVGRLPVNAEGIQFYDARDSSGESLWYAVSSAFYNQVGVVNSDTQGTITIFDQTGNLLYDGATNGVGAVIIAPGAPLAGQDRNADPLDPANYLDAFGAFNNSLFVNGDNDPDDGFRLGPVNNNNTLVINDQIIIVTAAEVVEMAEKAVLEAYRDSVNQYLADTGDVYPWLYNYQGVPDVPGLSSFFPADATFANELAINLDNFGRIPSIFANYFTEIDGRPIETRMSLDFALTYPVSPSTVRFDQDIPAVVPGILNQFNNAVQHSFVGTTTEPHSVVFSDIVDVVGNDGRLSITAITNEVFQIHLWFWDESEFGPATGVWTICPNGGDDLSDCNRDSAGNPTPGSASNEGGVEALHAIAEIDLSGTINFDVDYANAPTITVTSPAGVGGHATIQGVYSSADIIDVPVTLKYEIDRYYETSFDIQESGTIVAADLALSNLTLELRYYPELPAWAFDNDWHNSVMMAYADDYRPDSVTPPCTAGTDCIQVNNMGGNNDDKISILVIAGQHDWVDNGTAGLTDDLDTVFDVENENLDSVFDVRAANGNDKIMILDEL